MKKLALFLISFAILLGSAKTSFAESANEAYPT